MTTQNEIFSITSQTTAVGNPWCETAIGTLLFYFEVSIKRQIVIRSAIKILVLFQRFVTLSDYKLYSKNWKT